MQDGAIEADLRIALFGFDGAVVEIQRNLEVAVIGQEIGQVGQGKRIIGADPARRDNIAWRAPRRLLRARSSPD